MSVNFNGHVWDFCVNECVKCGQTREYAWKENTHCDAYLLKDLEKVIEAQRQRHKNMILSIPKQRQKGETAPLNDCEFWGENRASEYFLDVGCTIGLSQCDITQCKEYKSINKSKDQRIHSPFCEGEIDCPACKEETCGKVVVFKHFEDGRKEDASVICLKCRGVFNVG